MPDLSSSLDAHRRLPGVMTQCSWRAGWRSLLLRAYDEPGTVDEFSTASTSDQLIVLTTKGEYPIEVKNAGQWRRARSAIGTLGMTRAGDEATLRWRGGSPVSTLQLHLPGLTIREAGEALWDRDPSKVTMPNDFVSHDPLIEQIMLSLQDAMTSGAPDLYAQSTAEFLAVHLLQRHAGFAAPGLAGREEARMRRANAFMREHLSDPLSLDDLAREAGLSRFHFLRLYKQAHGETPFRRLTRLRIERARRLLRDADEQVIQIAFSCGYENPTHFASAFRRAVGVSPLAYRRQSR